MVFVKNCALCIAILSILACSAIGKNSDKELPRQSPTVTRTEPQVSRHSYDVNHLPPQMPATQPDEAGVTVSEFTCTAEVDGKLTRQSPNGIFTDVTVHVDSIHIVLKLKVTEWIDETASQKTWVHEDGHRMIALHFYEHADSTAGAIAKMWLNQSLTATGVDAQSTARKIIDQTAGKITNAYMQKVRDQSELVQEAYDRITEHGTNTVDEATAIDLALKEVGKEDKQ